MLCGNQIPVKNERFVPCGQCYACRVNRKRKVIGQLILEAAYAEKDSTFLTLTYNPHHYPHDGSLRPDHIRRYLNRLRQKEAFGPIRYFVVGEYGEKTQRAHYHMALFGIPPQEAEYTCQKLWSDDAGPIGYVQAGHISTKSIAYIAGYCLKKMGKNDVRLKGRYPEFNRRSKLPPLGAKGVEAIIDTLGTRSGAAAIAKSGDVPTQFRFEGRTYPFSDYWQRYIREEMGIPFNEAAMPWAVDPIGFMRGQLDAAEKSENAQRLDRYRNAGRRTL